MKILYVSQFFPPEVAAGGIRVAELAARWSPGASVQVLTGFPNYPNGKLFPGYREKRWRGIAREDWNGVGVVRAPITIRPNGGALDRTLNYLSFCASAAMTGSFLSRPDVIIATSPPLTVALCGYLLAQRFRVPWVFEVRDLWPESLAAAGATEQSRSYRALVRLAGYLYRKADTVVAVSPAIRAELVDRLGVDPSKAAVVENGVEDHLLEATAASRAGLRDELQLRGKFTVCYVGAIGLAHGLSTILEAAAAARTSMPNLVFLLVGDGSEAQELAKRARDQGLTNVTFLGTQPRERIPSILRACDAAAVLLKKSDIFKTVIPTKMLEAMAAGLPVILGVEGQAQAILEASGAGVPIAPGDATALLEAIGYLQNNPSVAAQMAGRGPDFVARNFSRSRLASRYLDLLRVLAGEEQPAGRKFAHAVK